MSRVASATIALAMAALTAWPVRTDGQIGQPFDAQHILRSVRDRLPVGTVRMEGVLIRGYLPRQRKVVRRFEAELAFGEASPRAVYSLLDAFGAMLCRLTVIRPVGAAPQLRFERGNPLQPASLPDMSADIEDTGITWEDLSLGFLWWPGGRVLGEGSVRGRDCHVIEFSDANRVGRPAARQGNRVRLWIDSAMLMLLQVEEYDEIGEPVRTLSVRNFKRIGDMWMVKDIDVRSHQVRDRTIIRIERIFGQGMGDDTGDLSSAVQ